LAGAPAVDDAEIARMAAEALEPFDREGGENPYTIHQDLQETMQNLVGIIRTEVELKQALTEIGELQERAAKAGIEGHRQYNPGWHLSIDLRSMLAVSQAVTKAALERTESRGGHTRNDYPGMDPEFGKVNVRVRQGPDGIAVEQIPLPQMPDDLKKLFEEGH
jgi:succinate dehydrogenase / fumarate reductase flavoprotein subunit